MSWVLPQRRGVVEELVATSKPRPGPAHGRVPLQMSRVLGAETLRHW
jgi:hypothetical protein